MTLKYFNVKNGLVTGNITLDASNGNVTGNYFIGNISVTSKANLGANANITITGGSSGQLLATDGSGNLYWAAPAGGGGIGGSNTYVQFNDSGTYGGNANFTFDKTTGVVTASHFSGEAGNLSNIQGANVTGAVAYATTANSVAGSNVSGAVAYATTANSVAGANVSGAVAYATTANSVAGANVSGQVGNSLVAGTVYTAAQPNITSVGTLTSVTTSGDGTIGGNLSVTGNLTVSGTVTSVNSTTVNINDINIVLANNATTAAQANGAGITINGASATFLYNSTSNAFTFSHPISANGALLTNIAGANVTGAVTYATTANSVAGANVIGQVSNALVAGTVYTAAQPNITSVGTLTSLNVTGNIASGNANLGNLVTANYFSGNGSLLTGVAKATSADSVANGQSNVNIASANANVTIAINGTTNVAVFSSGGVNVSGYLTTTGNITSGNANLGNLATANFFSGNGSSLSSITGANVTGAVSFATTANAVAGANVTGQVGNALVAGTVYTAAQPNITSVGTLTSLTVTGNIASGNANLGNLATANFFSGAGNNLSNIQGANVTGAVSYATTANSVAVANVSGIGNIATINKDGNASNILYGNGVFASAPVTYSNSNVATFLASFGSNTITTTGNITAGNANLGNAVVANYIVANGYYLTGVDLLSVGNALQADIANSLQVGNTTVRIPVANGNIVAAVNGSNVANITTAGVDVIGNITSGNANLGNLTTSNYFAGTLTTAAQPNITSVGTLTSLTVSGVSTLGAVGNVKISGGTTGQYLKTDGAGNLSWGTVSGSGAVSGTDKQVIFNDSGSYAGNAGFTFDKTNTALTVNNFIATSTANLGAVGNVIITGGSSGQVLKTDGSGGLSWGTAAGSESTVTSVDTFTGDGTTTDYTLSVTPGNKNQTLVNYNGAMQLKSAYSLSGAVISFSEAPANGSIIEVITQMGVTTGAGSLTVRTYTGDGSTATFSVSSGVNATNILVTENGVLQVPTTDYTVSGGTLTFTTAPNSGVHIQIRELGTSVSTITPAGSDTQVLFNDGGSFGNSASFTYSNTSHTMTVGSIMPAADLTYSLGNSTRRWSNLYLAGNTIHLGNATISVDDTSGAVVLTPAPTLANPTPTAQPVTSPRYISMVKTGTLKPSTGTSRYYPPANVQIRSVTASLSTPCAGTFSFAIKKNGTTAGTFSISANQYKLTTTTSSISVSSTDYLTVDVTSGIGASDLRIDLEYTTA